jgi:hypothetical protein
MGAYMGINRFSARGVRTGPSLERTLKGYIESTMSDLIAPNTIVCKIIEGENYYGDDDFVEFETKINGRALVFHCEAADDNDPKKTRGLIGVRDEETGEVVAGPTDPTTWNRVEAFVRFAVK